MYQVSIVLIQDEPEIWGRLELWTIVICWIPRVSPVTLQAYHIGLRWTGKIVYEQFGAEVPGKLRYSRKPYP